MIPSLVELSAKHPKAKPRAHATIVIVEPMKQEVATLLFHMAPAGALRGYYGQVRRLDLNKLEGTHFRVRVGRGDVILAIKRSDATTEERMKVIYNEYLVHRSVYACMQRKYPSATAYFAYPFEMVMPCDRIRPESRTSITPLSTPVAIELPEESDDMDAELLVTSCETTTGYVYTIQSWGCVVGEKSTSLEMVYNGLTYDQLRAVGQDVGTALRRLHACEYMHNDLAFRNILVCSTPSTQRVRAVILDFGLAQHEYKIDEGDFWSEMSQCIAEIYKINTGDDWSSVWKEWSTFKGQSPLIDAAYEAWSNDRIL